MIRVRSMTAADLPLGLHLSDTAGWNQVLGDWQRFLDLQPDGCFVAESGGAAVGTTTTCILGSVAWIAMVLVAEEARGRGIGTALMEHALSFLDARGVATVRLDSRPMGQRLYERLGFVEQYRISHYEGRAIPPQGPPPACELRPLWPGLLTGPPAASEGWEELMSMDERITRTDRRRLLRRLFSEHPQSVRFLQMDGRLSGYWASRPGSKTIRLGPCVATAGAGPMLLADAWQRHTGQFVSIDVPSTNEAAKQWVQSHGLTEQHTLTRMCRGTPVVEQVEFLWASSGPEKG